MSQGNRYRESRTSSEGQPRGGGVWPTGPSGVASVASVATVEPQAAGPEHPGSRFGGRASRRLMVGAVLAVGLIAAACSASPSAVANKTTATSKASTGTKVPATVIGSTMSATLGTILVNPAGFTLYRFTADKGGQSACTGACAQLWPPFTVAAGSKPTGANGTVGVFATSMRADGTTQVTYNGSPLYTFGGDKTAGSTAGQGVLGEWSVVTPSATPAAAPTATTAPAAGSTSTTSQAPSTPAITPTTTAPQPAATTPAPTSPPATAPPATSPPPTSPPTTAPPPATTTPTTMGYGY
jgi:predicted lipoprotein with Yx(FWY)xxD motif